MRLSFSRSKVAVTLRARYIRCGLQERRTFVFHVACRATWSKNLRGLVSGGIMTGQAGLVRYLCTEGASLSDVAQRALLREHRVSMRERTARIQFLPALRALRQEPCHRDQRYRH